MFKNLLTNKVYIVKLSSWILAVIIIVSILIVSISDNNNINTSLDGLVVTDKSGKSYILQHNIGKTFKVYEFDTMNMRMKR